MDELAAVEFLEQQRFPHGPDCVHCGSIDVYQMKDAKTGERNRRFLWRCHDCKKQFTVRVGTVFEDSRIPLRHWCYAFWAACASKKGVSAKQIQRMTGVSYKSALFMMHRIRWAMAAPNQGPKLTGTVEVDETYVGGKPRYRPGGRAGRAWSTKTPVVGMVERGGNIRAKVVPNVTREHLRRLIMENIDKSARIMTDDLAAYPNICWEFKGGHETVCHSKREYVRGEASTNTIEGFFALLKRGVYGTFHSVSRKHLHRYVSEFAFRWNTRKLEDGERVGIAIRAAEGRRLMYHRPTAN